MCVTQEAGRSTEPVPVTAEAKLQVLVVSSTVVLPKAYRAPDFLSCLFNAFVDSGSRSSVARDVRALCTAGDPDDTEVDCNI